MQRERRRYNYHADIFTDTLLHVRHVVSNTGILKVLLIDLKLSANFHCYKYVYM